jgi:hypothetical protein
MQQAVVGVVQVPLVEMLTGLSPKIPLVALVESVPMRTLSGLQQHPQALQVGMQQVVAGQVVTEATQIMALVVLVEAVTEVFELTLQELQALLTLVQAAVVLVEQEAQVS